MGVDYGKTLELQGGKCAICHKEAGKRKEMAIDHDHKTGKIRGILCSFCNFALGFCKDDPEILKSMIAYLETGGSGSEIVYCKPRPKKVSKSDDFKNKIVVELFFGPKSIKQISTALMVDCVNIEKIIEGNPDKFSILDGKIHLTRLISVYNKDGRNQSDSITENSCDRFEAECGLI